MASIRTHGKRCSARFKINGQVFTTTIPYPSTKTGQEAAARVCRVAENRLRTGESWEEVSAWLREEPSPEEIAKGITLEDAAWHYLDHVAPNESGVTDKTLRGYQSLWYANWSKFGKKELITVTRKELTTHIANRSISPKSKREAVSFIKRVFASQELHTLENWTMKKSKTEATPEPDPYVRKERDRLLSALKEWPIAHRYFATGFYTGMRTGEMLGLVWEHYDERKQTFDVCQSMVDRNLVNHTKTQKRRQVIVPPILTEILEPERERSGFVFTTPDGHMFKDADWLMDKWNRAHEITKIKKSKSPNYPWRHTFISLALANMKIEDLARMVGNSPEMIRRSYFRWIPDDDEVNELRNQIASSLE